MQTGFPRADARDDFDRALREARLARLAGWLSGRAGGGDRLPVLGEVTVTGGSRQELVPIDRIVGSVEPMTCFDRHFRPTSQLPRERFERIDAGVRSGRGMDPVELYRCGGDYYVDDGHHRIAVARALGERRVWATVSEVRPSQSATTAAAKGPVPGPAARVASPTGPSSSRAWGTTADTTADDGQRAEAPVSGPGSGSTRRPCGTGDGSGAE